MAKARPPRSLAALLADIQSRPSVYFPALANGPAGRTAQAATYLNYGPQFDALNALLGSARQERRATVQSARRSGQAGSQGIQRIRDQFVQGAEDSLGGLGGPVAPGATTSSPEQRAAQQLGLSGTALSGMLSTMAAQQVAGIGTQQEMARRQFSQARDDIGGKLLPLLQQAGAYNTQQYQSLAGERRKAQADAQRALAQQRVSLMTAGINPDTGAYDPSLDAPKAVPKDPINSYGIRASVWETMTPQQRQRAAREWKTNTSTGNGGSREKNLGVRDDIQRIGKFGERASTTTVWVNPDTGAVVKPDGDGNYPDGAKQRKLTDAEVAAAIEKKFPKAPPIVVRAAQEWAIDRTISRKTYRALKRRYPRFRVPSGWIETDSPVEFW